MNTQERDRLDPVDAVVGGPGASASRHGIPLDWNQEDDRAVSWLRHGEAAAAMAARWRSRSPIWWGCASATSGRSKLGWSPSCHVSTPAASRPTLNANGTRGGA